MRLVECKSGLGRGARVAGGTGRWHRTGPRRDATASPGPLDPSGPYRKTFTHTLPDAPQVADPFHLAKHANSKLDECRRRVQNESLGHRGRHDDPLYRSRRLLTTGHERLNDRGEAKLLGLHETGDPRREVRLPWHATDTIHGIHAINDPTRPTPS